MVFSSPKSRRFLNDPLPKVLTQEEKDKIATEEKAAAKKKAMEDKLKEEEMIVAALQRLEEEKVKVQIERTLRIKSLEDELHKLKLQAAVVSPQPEPFSPNLGLSPGGLKKVQNDSVKLNETIRKLEHWLLAHERELPRMSEERRDFYMGYRDMYDLLTSVRTTMETLEQDNEHLRSLTPQQPGHYHYIPPSPQAGIMFGTPPFVRSPQPNKWKGRK